jgi:NAD(P)-dependent dehydrogenase (short-subunit alcohol dehydrogenase family)
MNAIIKDKVVVVTGASAGIGAALAEVLGEHGARPVLVARRAPALAEVAAKCGPYATTVVADVTIREQVEGIVATSLKQHGHIDVWVNNAGRGITRHVSELTDEDFDDMMRVNVKSALYGMQAVLPHFRTRGAGHIINVSSLLGRVPLAPFRSAYSAAKHALNALTANLRMELAGDFPHIHVSSVHPGIVATEFGLNARHGGPDSRQLMGAQPVSEVAGVLLEVIASPRADVYTRPQGKAMVVNYFAADDMAAAERQGAFSPTAPRPGTT